MSRSGTGSRGETVTASAATRAFSTSDVPAKYPAANAPSIASRDDSTSHRFFSSGFFRVIRKRALVRTSCTRR